MKKFLSGVLCATIVFSLALSALAISGNVSFNLSAIKFDGVVISETGDGYTLPNGCVAPASITYTDEKGGGTTYLPVRRIGELAGVTIDWDGAVVVKSKEFVEQEKRDAEKAAALDYSNWSAEDEAAYQEFKGMWEISGRVEFNKFVGEDVEVYDLVPVEDMDIHTLSEKKTDAEKRGFLARLLNELRVDLPKVQLRLFPSHDKDSNLELYYSTLF